MKEILVSLKKFTEECQHFMLYYGRRIRYVQDELSDGQSSAVDTGYLLADPENTLNDPGYFDELKTFSSNLETSYSYFCKYLKPLLIEQFYFADRSNPAIQLGHHVGLSSFMLNEFRWIYDVSIARFSPSRQQAKESVLRQARNKGFITVNTYQLAKIWIMVQKIGVAIADVKNNISALVQTDPCSSFLVYQSLYKQLLSALNRLACNTNDLMRHGFVSFSLKMAIYPQANHLNLIVDYRDRLPEDFHFLLAKNGGALRAIPLVVEESQTNLSIRFVRKAKIDLRGNTRKNAQVAILSETDSEDFTLSVSLKGRLTGDSFRLSFNLDKETFYEVLLDLIVEAKCLDDKYGIVRLVVNQLKEMASHATTLNIYQKLYGCVLQRLSTMSSKGKNAKESCQALSALLLESCIFMVSAMAFDKNKIEQALIIVKQKIEAVSQGGLLLPTYLASLLQKLVRIDDIESDIVTRPFSTVDEFITAYKEIFYRINPSDSLNYFKVRVFFGLIMRGNGKVNINGNVKSLRHAIFVHGGFCNDLIKGSSLDKIKPLIPYFFSERENVEYFLNALQGSGNYFTALLYVLENLHGINKFYNYKIKSFFIKGIIDYYCDERIFYDLLQGAIDNGEDDAKRCLMLLLKLDDQCIMISSLINNSTKEPYKTVINGFIESFKSEYEKERDRYRENKDQIVGEAGEDLVSYSATFSKAIACDKLQSVREKQYISNSIAKSKCLNRRSLRDGIDLVGGRDFWFSGGIQVYGKDDQDLFPLCSLYQVLNTSCTAAIRNFALQVESEDIRLLALVELNAFEDPISSLDGKYEKSICNRKDKVESDGFFHESLFLIKINGNPIIGIDTKFEMSDKNGVLHPDFNYHLNIYNIPSAFTLLEDVKNYYSQKSMDPPLLIEQIKIALNKALLSKFAYKGDKSNAAYEKMEGYFDLIFSNRQYFNDLMDANLPRSTTETLNSLLKSCGNNGSLKNKLKKKVIHFYKEEYSAKSPDEFEQGFNNIMVELKVSEVFEDKVSLCEFLKGAGDGRSAEEKLAELWNSTNDDGQKERLMFRLSMFFDRSLNASENVDCQKIICQDSVLKFILRNSINNLSGYSCVLIRKFLSTIFADEGLLDHFFNSINFNDKQLSAVKILVSEDVELSEKYEKWVKFIGKFPENRKGLTGLELNADMRISCPPSHAHMGFLESTNYASNVIPSRGKSRHFNPEKAALINRPIIP